MTPSHFILPEMTHPLQMVQGMGTKRFQRETEAGWISIGCLSPSNQTAEPQAQARCRTTTRSDLLNLNHDSSARHKDQSHLRTTMSGPSYENRQAIILPKIYSLLHSLDPSAYDGVTPKVEYWIEWALTEHSTTVNELVDKVASVAWESSKSQASVAQFLKEFREPHRSEQAKSFVNKLCPHVLRWFAVASAEGLTTTEPKGWCSDRSAVAICGGRGFIRAGSFGGFSPSH